MRTFALYLLLFSLVYRAFVGAIPPACSGGNCPPTPTPPTTSAPPTKTPVPPSITPIPPTATENTPTSPPPETTATNTPYPPDDQTPTPFKTSSPTPGQPYPPPPKSTPTPTTRPTLPIPTPTCDWKTPPSVDMDNPCYRQPDKAPTPTALPATGFWDTQGGLTPIELILFALVCIETILTVWWARKKWNI